PPEYSMYELFKPLRVIINIKDARISDKLSLPLKPKAGPIVYVKGRSFDTMTPPIARIELFLAEDHEYSVALDRNDLVVRFGKEMPSSPTSAPLAAKAVSRQGPVAAQTVRSEQVDKKLYQDLFEQGKKYFNAADYEKAYATFFKAFELDPANLSLNFILGRAAYEMGDYEAAVMAFERILIADPEVIRVKLELAKSYYLLGSFETASSFFEELLTADLPASVRQNIEAFLATKRETGK
ncbi:MAG: tetratricopeptide repeat protein, partial [Desulfobulbaceae bacterium]|nr:tetratricopeptide repeat protein [Desulfobulbaceae bacterium]